MDAKPQRLARSRTLRDENQPPLVLPGKTLHHRNKSSPALSTSAQLAAAKVAPKRAAFADVTNARSFSAVQEDAVTTGKGGLAVLKEKVPEQSKAGAPLQRPAQRPLSVSSIRGFFNSLGQVSTIGQQDAVPQQPAKTLSRKGTTVFREPEVGAQAIAAAELAVEGISREGVLRQSDVAQGALMHEKVDVHGERVQIPNAAAHAALMPTDEAVARNIIPTSSAMPSIIQPQPIRPVEPLMRQKNASRKSGSSGLAAYAAVPEQWEAEQYIESEGDYTTARSLKSRGELTTNQTTVILAPNLTAAAEREIAEADLFVQSSQEVAELEEDESWDPSMVAEYSEDIFAYMKNMEAQMRPNPHYMDNQTEVQWSMRSVLMDWLVQVHHRFSLLPETLFLCVNYVDRFLSCKVVSLGKLQLVGATALFVAAKYEEINCPSVHEIIYMVDGGYSIDEVLKAERFMLSMLQFELGFPGPMSFLRRISKADDYDLETRTLAKYFMEITVMDERFVGCIPSYTAAGAHCLARLMLDKGLWSHKHVHYSGYTYGQLRPLLLTVLSCCDDPQRHHAAVFDKYADKRFKRASTFVQCELNKGFMLPAVTVRNSIGYDDISGRCRMQF